MEEPVVELPNGLIRGVVEKHEDGFDYYSFKGVPYAEPPVGELRFQDPIPKKSWTGVIDCKNDGPICLQYDFITKVVSYEEDCLYLNVFTRSINETNKNSPVMMVIHGGGCVLKSASSLFYGPDYLIRKDVVLVMPNHRIGVLGFLDLEDEVAPGNQGLKDLVMVLEWIQRSIRAFGGNPNNVTVFGTTAGGALAHQMALSPMTTGLIHKVISLGATAYNTWIGIANPKSHAIQLCSLLGQELTDSTEILQLLKSVDAKRLQEAQEKLRQSLIIPFGPGIDSKSPNPFMPIHRYTAADNGVHLPYLVGCNARSGLIILYDEFTFPGVSRQEYFKLFDRDFGRAFLFNTRDILTHYGLSEMQVRRLYYKNETISTKNLDNYVDFTNDFYFFESIHRFARVQAERGSAATYLYHFNYDLKSSLGKMILSDVADEYKQGCCFFDDIPFLFRVRVFDKPGQPGPLSLKKGSRNYKMMEQMTEMWTNFARYGKPTTDTSELIPVHWKPINDGTVLRYLEIGEDITMQSTINTDQKLLSAKSVTI